MANKISIITPVRNGEKYLRTAIDSVLGQDYQPWEHIIVDGASTDGTVAILKSYPHLKWISEPDHGPGDAFNKGCAMATGDILCILPADDCFKPMAFSRAMVPFVENRDCQWVAGYCNYIDDQGQEIRKPITWYKNLLLRHHSFHLLLTESYLSAMSVFFKRDLLTELGPFDIFSTTEYSVWLSISSKYELQIVKEYLASFRIHSGTMTTSYRNFPATRALEAAKKYRRAHPVAFFIHYCNYLKLVGAYSILNRLNK